MGLLKDPVPRSPGDRRADEVDSLFALPQSLSLIAPRLRRYLEMIFVAGEWSAKPLFLRGIYFTSAMREGAALDQELAEAIGVSFDALPEGKPWERERAYFLRDLFTEKVFRERGLVTRATNTKRMLRQRQGMLLGFGAVALAAFLGFSFYQHNQLQESIGIHEQYWRGAAKDWSPGKWHPLLKADFAGGTEFRYLGDQPVDGFTEKSLVDVHASLQSIATRPINTGWVFKPLAGMTNIKDDRIKAQHIVFNASVVTPVLTAARQRMQNADTTSAEDPTKAAANLLNESRAVAALLHIEADAVHKPDSADSVPAYFSTLLGYSLNKEVADWDKISALLTTNYAKEPWPPAWVARGSANLAANPPIQKALERIKGYATLAGKTHQTHLAVIQDLLAALKEFQSKERELNDRPTLEAKSDSLKSAMEGLYSELETKRTALDLNLQKADKAGVLSGSGSSLKAAYDQVIASGKSQGDEAFALVQKACVPYLGDDKNRLFYDVDSTLKLQRVQIAKTLEGALSVDDVAALKALDDAYLADSGDHKTRIYTLRWKLYEDTHSQLHRDLVFKNLVGTEWRAAADIKTHMQDVTKFVEDNKVKLKDPLKACDYFLQIGERSADSKLIDTYLAEVREKLGSQLQFPLVWPPSGNALSTEKLKEAGNTLTDIEKDIDSEWVKGLEPDQKARLVKVRSTIDPVEKFRGDLPGLAGTPGTFTVSLLNYNDQMSLSGERSALNEWRGVVVGGIVLRTSVATDTPVGSFPVDGDFNVTFRQYPDGTGGSHTVSGGGSWSVLRLLKQGGFVKQFDGGKRYRIGFPLEGHLIWFEFTFEKPLPDLAAWPSREKALDFH